MITEDDEYGRPAAGNRKAENAIIYLLVTAEDVVDSLLGRLQPKDFCYDECRFLFEEIGAMRKAGVPLSDTAARIGWFREPKVRQRMKDAKLDDWCERSEELSSRILEIAIDGEFATVAHLDWYIGELRKWRVVRGLRMLSWQLTENIERQQPLEVLDWLDEKVGQLKGVAQPLLEKTCAESAKSAKR